MSLMLLLFLAYSIQLVISQSPMIIRSPVNQSVCAGGTVNFTCVVMFTSGSSGPAFWYTNDGVSDASRKPGHSVTYDSNGRSAPANVTTVLTVTNVGISDNGADYFCAQGFNGTRSDTVFLTVFGRSLDNHPSQPQFEYCISYNDGQPTLQVISYVPSYQTDNSNSQSATCSLLSDMQYNCTAKFAVDVIPSVNAIESVNVTVNGPCGSASSLKNINQRVNTILSVGVSYIREDSATLSSEMPCFSPDLLCAVTNLTTNNMIVTVKNITDNDNGLVMAYSYPNCIILLSDLNSGTTYNYCVVAINATTMVQVGDPVCGNFTTNISYTESDEGMSQMSQWPIVVGVVAPLLLASLLVFIVVMIWYKRRRSSEVLVTCCNDWLASESDRTVKSDDSGSPAITEVGLSSEVIQQQMNETDELQLSHNADDASREQLEQWSTGRLPKQSDKQATHADSAMPPSLASE